MTTSEPVERLRALAFDALGRVDLPERTRAVFAGSPQPSSIIAIGKSAGPMLDGALRARQSPCPTLAVVPDGAPAPDTPSVELLRAAHPYPDGRVDHIAARLTALVTASTAEQPAWLCLSGGGSACLS